MPNPQKRKGPGESANYTRANTENTKSILSEILGMVAAALIFTATVLTSAFGMTGALGHMEPIVLAEVDDGR